MSKVARFWTEVKRSFHLKDLVEIFFPINILIYIRGKESIDHALASWSLTADIHRVTVESSKNFVPDHIPLEVHLKYPTPLYYNK